MKTKADSVRIVLEIECDVYYRAVAGSYGDDADGRQGVLEVDYEVETVEVQTIVPPAVQAWAKAAAQDQFAEMVRLGKL